MLHLVGRSRMKTRTRYCFAQATALRGDNAAFASNVFPVVRARVCGKLFNACKLCFANLGGTELLS